MFESVHLANLRHNEYIQFIRNFLEILSDYDLETLKIKTQSDSLSALIENMIALYMPDRGSALTKLLQEDDERRDKAINGIQSAIFAYTYHYDVEVKGAANVLLPSIKKYGTGIAKQNYQAETAIIDSIVEEWKREAVYVDALSKLSLTDWLNELETSNTKFNTDYLERVKENAEAPEVKIVDLRKQINEAYHVLIDRIAAFDTIGEGVEYANIIKLTNSLIEKYNAVLAARNHKEEEEIITEE